MTRSLLLVALLLAGGCTGGLDVRALADPGDAQRRGAVEVAVKGAYPGILDEIALGAGPSLERALDAAGVPEAERPTRLVQLQGDLGLYAANPGALVAALVLYGS